MQVSPTHQSYPAAFALLNAYQRTILFILGPTQYKKYVDCLLEVICPKSEKTLMSSLPMIGFLLRDNSPKWFHYYHTQFATSLNWVYLSDKDHVPSLGTPTDSKDKKNIDRIVGGVLDSSAPSHWFVASVTAKEYREEVVRMTKKKRIDDESSGQFEQMKIGEGASAGKDDELDLLLQELVTE